MRLLGMALLLTWLGSLVAGGVVCYLILYPPSRFGRAVIATMVGASVVAAVLTLTAPPLGGMEIYRYLSHGVLASVGEIRSGLATLGRVALGVGGERPATADETSRATPVAADARADEQPALTRPDHPAVPAHQGAVAGHPEPQAHDGNSGGDRQDLRGLVPAALVDDGSTRRRHRDRREAIDSTPRSDRSERLLDNPEISGVPASDVDERGNKFPRTDKLLGTDGPDRDKDSRADKPEKGEKTNKTQKPDKIEDTIEKTEKVDRADKVEKAEKPEKVETAEKVDRIDKIEKVEKVVRVDRVEKIERVERPTRIEKPTRPERFERPERRGR